MVIGRGVIPALSVCDFAVDNELTSERRCSPQTITRRTLDNRVWEYPRTYVAIIAWMLYIWQQFFTKGACMDRAKFYSELRKSTAVFGRSLSQKQVEVMEAILDETLALPNSHVAYIMATAYHETGTPRMTPTTESLHYTTAARIRAVWPSRFPTLAAAQPFVRNARKLANHVYNGRLGNRSGSDDGWNFRGRGLDHLTGRDNYQRSVRIVGADVVSNPERMLEPEIAVKSLVNGMTTGRYRGHKLSDFEGPDGGFNFVRARSIVNADTAKNGELVAAHARAFMSALAAAGRRPARGAVGPVRTAEAIRHDDPAERPAGWIAALVTIVTRFLSRR